MDPFICFLEASYDQSLEWKSLAEINIVLGNESGDLDSIVSSMAYAHYLKTTASIPKDENIAFFPVLNFGREKIDYNLEQKFLFEKVKINPDKLIYRNNLNFEEMLNEFSKCDKKFNTYLVDHHNLREKDQILTNTVRRVFDHRPLDQESPLAKLVNIENVASCCTLIARELFDGGYEMGSNLAYLMYCTIIMDMKGFSNPGTKDEEIKELLRAKFTKLREPAQAIYRKLYKLYRNNDQLTSLQILMKDLKTSDEILYPNLTSSAEEFVKRPDSFDAIETLCQQHESRLAVLIGMVVTRNRKPVPNIGIYFPNQSSDFIKEFVQEFEKISFNSIRSDSWTDNFIVFSCKKPTKIRGRLSNILPKVYENVRQKLTQ